MKAVFSFQSFRHAVFRAASVLVAVAVLAALPACDDEKTRNEINERAAETSKTIADMDRQAPAKRYNPLVVTDRVWAGSEALRMTRGMPLPPKYETARGVTLIATDPMSIADIANAVTEQTGLPVRVSEAGGKAAAPATAAASTMPVSYEGPLSGLMERVSGYFGVGWRYDGATITLSRFETRVFQIEALPGTQGVTENTSSSSTSSTSTATTLGSTGSGTATPPTPPTSELTQTVKFTIDFKYWDELGQILTSMLGGTGTVVVSPSIGTVTVSTTPEIMRSVAAYLAQENQRLSRQIAINLQVYAVSLTEGMDFNIAFSAILNKLTDFGITNVAGPGSPTDLNTFSSAAQMTVAIFNPNIGKPFGQLQDVFNAVSGVGDATKVASFPLITLNNRPVSRRIGTNQTYVSGATAGTVVSGAGTTGSGISTSTLQLGFTVQVTPRLLDDGRILLEYSLSDQDLIGFGKVAVDGIGDIETPNTTIREFVQQSVLKSGSMLILGGADEEDLAQNSNGVGNPFNYLLGGGVSSSKGHTMVIVTVTPQVIDVPRSEQD